MEFELIANYFKPLSLANPSFASITRPGYAASSNSTSTILQDLAPNDDGAVLQLPANQQLVVVTDTLVSGVHFFADANPFDIGWKSLAVNLSDLAAMGAKPAFYSLAISLPKNYANHAWLQAFSAGLSALALPLNLPLIGGDTTQSPHLTITITAQGLVEANQFVTRSGAKVGDDIYITGFVGDAGCALASLQTGKQPATKAVLAKFLRPEPRVQLGLRLAEFATSAIDVSDGLLADLSHILQASKVGAQLDSAALPLQTETLAWAGSDLLMALSAGEDFELCFSANPEARTKIAEIAAELDLKISRIGEITEDSGELKLDQQVITQQNLGYLHF